MKGRNIALTASAALIGVALACTVWCWNPTPRAPTLQEALDIPPASLLIHLYPPDKTPTAQSKDRSVDAVDQTGKRHDSYLSFLDGTTEDDHYYPDGRRIRASEDYFAPTKAGRLQHARAHFAPDGETYHDHVVYRPSGTLERTGHRLRDGRYEQRYMFEDGVTPCRIRYFDPTLAFFTETIYRWNAQHTATFVYAKIVRGDFQGQFYVSVYREDGTLYASLKHSDGDDYGRLLAADGTHTVSEWQQSMNMSYYRQFVGDTLTQEWVSITGRMTIDIYDPVTNKRTMHEVWKERPLPGVPGGKRYLLMRATQIDADGKLAVGVEMSNDGSHAITLITPKEDKVIVRSLDEKGRVVKQELESQSGTTLPLPIDQGFVKVDPALTSLPSHTEVIKFNDFGPQHLYDYR